MKRFFRDHSLSLTVRRLVLVFAFGKLVAGRLVLTEERIQHGTQPVDFARYTTTPHALEALSEYGESEFIFLRGKGSLEPKRVESPHRAHD